MLLQMLQTTPAGTLAIDWSVAEAKLGFPVHPHLKDLYSRILVGRTPYGTVRGTIHFAPAAFVKRYVNRDDWLTDANGGMDHASLTLHLLRRTDAAYVADFLHDAFFGDWTGGNDFGRRAYLGELLINIGQISLVCNNDTGEFEWVDFGYGYFEVYTENPYGIIADAPQEFLDKLMQRR